MAVGIWSLNILTHSGCTRSIHGQYSTCDEHSYVYVWNGSLHLQGHLTQGYEQYAQTNWDTGEGQELSPADVWPDYARVFSRLEAKSTEEPVNFTKEDLMALRDRFYQCGEFPESI